MFRLLPFFHLESLSRTETGTSHRNPGGVGKDEEQIGERRGEREGDVKTEKDGGRARTSYHLEELIKILEENVMGRLSIFLLRHLT